MLATLYKKPLWQYKKPLWQFLKQPLVHFLVLGGLIFLAYALTADPAAEAEASPGGNTIVVDRATLLDYMQYQAQAFEPDVFEAQLAAMSDEEVDALVAAYVREEALYREGLGMGMDQADYVIRQRIVQKVEFLLENLVAADVRPTDAELQAYYDAHRAEYLADSVYTFTHIFFDGQADMAAARTKAEALLADSANIAFEQSSQHGDRYPFLQNYVERTRDFVGNNFSADFVAQLDMLTPGENWQGPFASRYGWHLVMLRARSEPMTPPLAEIRDRVLDDYRYDALLQNRADAEARVIAEYPVVLQLE
jgi:parvulin-like peptidyl-prolyl isomerase